MEIHLKSFLNGRKQLLKLKRGVAAKAQVQAMVQRLLQLPAAPRPDAADALGLAITHAHAGRAVALLHAAGAGRSTSSMYKRR